MAVTYFSGLLSELEGEIQQARADLREPTRDPARLKRLLKLLEKRNRLMRQRDAFTRST